MVRIKNKNYNKLSQLDRIEYSLREAECERDWNFNNVCFSMLIIVSVFIIGGYRNVAVLLFVVSAYAIVLNIGLTILSIILNRRDREKLVEEFFDIVVKKRKSQ